MPKLRAAMHLDTVFTFADRDCRLLYPDIVYGIAPSPSAQRQRQRRRVDKEKAFVEVVAEALELQKLRVVETGGNGTSPSAAMGQR